MNLLDLSEAETFAVNQILAARVADLSAYGAKAIIRADVIRALMLRVITFRTDRGSPLMMKAPATGIYVKNAIIQSDNGWLNLENSALDDGSDLPHLSLENCQIACNLNFKSTHIRGLSLKNSKVRLVDADHARINGLLDICFLKPLELNDGAQGHGFCRLSLRGAHIIGGIDARGAKLACEPKRSDFIPYVKRARYALDLPQSRIVGDVRLFPNFEAIGGVNINNAHITGAFQAHGALFTNEEEDYALHAKGVEITGKVSLDSHQKPTTDDTSPHHYSNFTARGSIHIENAVFGNGLEMKGANIDGTINASNISIHGDVNLSTYSNPYDFTPFKCSGKIEFYGANIHGDVNLNGAQLKRNETAETDTSLDLSSSKIEGAVFLSTWYSKYNKSHLSFFSNSTLKLDHSHISNDLCLSGAKIFVDVCPNETYLHEEPQLDDRCLAINASGLKLGGYALMAIDYTGLDSNAAVQSDGKKFEVFGDILLDNAEIGFDFDMTSAHIDGHIVGRNLKVGGKLKMCVPEKQKITARAELKKDISQSLKFFCTKRISLSGAIIQSDFDLSGAELQRGLRFRGGVVESALIINIDGGKDIRIPSSKDQNVDALSPDITVSKSSIDLTNAKVFILSDHDGENTLYGQSFILRLEGFRYDRFRSVRDEESLIRQIDFQLASEQDKQIARADHFKYFKMKYKPLNKVDRKKWLRMQYEFHDVNNNNIETLENYSPDPYITLYKALRSTGDNIQADSIIINKNNIETRLIYGNHRDYVLPFGTKFITSLIIVTFRKLFDYHSGYGLRVGRSTLSFITFIILTSLWVSENKKLMTNTSPNINVDCDNSINSFLFTLETIIPTFNLGQKNICNFTAIGDNYTLIQFGIITILGWIMTSLTLITWSGYNRRLIEP